MELAGSEMERRLQHLELRSLGTMKESVAEFYRGIPGKKHARAKWSADAYPVGTEKELYAELAHTLLAAPAVMIPAMLGSLGTSPAEGLARTPDSGHWRAYRLSTIRFRRGTGWTSPMCFPGAAGANGIADVGIFLNPRVNETKGQVDADRMLYLEIKSADHHRHTVGQLRAHLEHLENNTAPDVGYLAAIGGRCPAIHHPRWLGHVGLVSVLEPMAEVAAGLPNLPLAGEIGGLLARKRKPR